MGLLVDIIDENNYQVWLVRDKLMPWELSADVILLRDTRNLLRFERYIKYVKIKTDENYLVIFRVNTKYYVEF